MKKNVKPHQEDYAHLGNKKETAKRKLLFSVTAVALTGYIVWRILFSLPTQYGVVNLVMGILLLLAELVGFFQMFTDYRQLIYASEPEMPRIPMGWFPDVDVFIATHNESVDLVYKTANACTFLRYPDKKKVHVYICDDSNRPEMAALAKELGVGYFGLENNTLAKAGNLNHALRHTDSPLVVTLDADMIPRSEFLMETVPYFFLPRVRKTGKGRWAPLEQENIDPTYKIGYVQTPQSFYNPDLFQYHLYSESNVPNEQDYFFKEVNVAHNHDNAPIYAGSNTMLSREALEEVGYIATDSITEDFMTGIRIQKAKYRNFAISKILAHGLAPDRIKSLLNQRERWARGNIQTIRRERVLTSRSLTLGQKFSNFSSFMYWQGYIARMLFLLAPIVQVLFNMRFVDASFWQIIVFWLPAYLIYNFSLKVLSGHITNQHWSNVVNTVFAPFLSGPVLSEDLGISKHKFVVTEKDRRKTHKRRRVTLLALPHAILAAACAIAIAITIQDSISMRTLYNPIVLYWLVIGMKDLLFAVFFMFGRTNVRMTERFYVRVPVSMVYGGSEHHGETSDISEGGLGVVFDKPVYLPPDEILRVVVRSEQYTAELECELVAVLRAGDKWKYGFRIDAMSAESKRMYMQIVYDRMHTLPVSMNPHASIFVDININLIRRTRDKQENHRRLPRLKLQLPFRTDAGQEGKLLDFNYDYAGVQLSFDVDPEETITLEYGPELVLVLQPEIRAARNRALLFRVVNRNDLLDHPDFDRLLDAWLALEKLPEEAKPMGRAVVRKKTEAPRDADGAGAEGGK